MKADVKANLSLPDKNEQVFIILFKTIDPVLSTYWTASHASIS